MRLLTPTHLKLQVADQLGMSVEHMSYIDSLERKLSWTTKTMLTEMLPF